MSVGPLAARPRLPVPADYEAPDPGVALTTEARQFTRNVRETESSWLGRRASAGSSGRASESSSRPGGVAGRCEYSKPQLQAAFRPAPSPVSARPAPMGTAHRGRPGLVDLSTLPAFPAATPDEVWVKPDGFDTVLTALIEAERAAPAADQVVCPGQGVGSRAVRCSSVAWARQRSGWDFAPPGGDEVVRGLGGSSRGTGFTPDCPGKSSEDGGGGADGRSAGTVVGVNRSGALLFCRVSYRCPTLPCGSVG